MTSGRTGEAGLARRGDVVCYRISHISTDGRRYSFLRTDFGAP